MTKTETLVVPVLVIRVGSDVDDPPVRDRGARSKNEKSAPSVNAERKRGGNPARCATLRAYALAYSAEAAASAAKAGRVAGQLKALQCESMR
jgi:hypothetical protein